MSWGTYYKYDGYLSHISKRELEEKRQECQELNDMYWREILVYMAQTPPSMTKDCEGEEYPWAEFIATKIQDYRDRIEDNDRLMARIDDCLETMKEHPEDVTEG